VKQKYRVVLPVEVDGKVYEFGSVVELTLDIAKGLSHALIAVEKEEGK